MGDKPDYIAEYLKTGKITEANATETFHSGLVNEEKNETKVEAFPSGARAVGEAEEPVVVPYGGPQNERTLSADARSSTSEREVSNAALLSKLDSGREY